MDKQQRRKKERSRWPKMAGGLARKKNCEGETRMYIVLGTIAEERSSTYLREA